MKTPHTKTATIYLLFAGLLTGCGGGGGDSGGSASLERIAVVSGVAANLSDQTTANKVSADAAQAPSASMGLASNGKSFSGLVGIESTPSQHRPMNWSQIGQKLAQFSFEQAIRKGSAISAVTQIASCSNGGSITMNATMKNNSGLNSGDTFSFAAHDCSQSTVGETLFMNGEMRMTVLAGNNMSPDSLNGATLGFEMLPLVIRITGSGISNLDATLDGGFKIQFISSSSFQLSVMDGHSGVTELGNLNGVSTKTTMSNFDFTISNALDTTAYLYGTATVDTTRVSILANGATKYSWAAESGAKIAYDTSNDTITGGVMLLTSPANSTKIRLSFGQTCSSTTRCVLMEKDPGTGVFAPVNTYTWADFSQLQ